MPDMPEVKGPIVRTEGQAHDECALGPCARVEAVPLPEAAVHGRFVAEAGEHAPVQRDASHSVPLLLLAPSRSPPV
jgi:hypothetical protein